MLRRIERHSRLWNSEWTVHKLYYAGNSIMSKVSSSQVIRKAVVLGIVGCMLLATASGIVAAAVSGDFSATYDGYDDGESTDARGHEIAIEGQMEVTGDAAVDPTIVVTGAQPTVLDTASVTVFVEGDRSIQFDRNYQAGEVRMSANEVPAGTTIRIEYLTYYVGGSDSRSITASEVQFNYDRPGGDRTRETFQVDATLEKRPEDFVAAANSGSQLSQIQRVLSYVGGLAIILALLALIVKALGNDTPPGGGGPGPGN